MRCFWSGGIENIGSEADDTDLSVTHTQIAGEVNIMSARTRCGKKRHEVRIEGNTSICNG